MLGTAYDQLLAGSGSNAQIEEKDDNSLAAQNDAQTRTIDQVTEAFESMLVSTTIRVSDGTRKALKALQARQLYMPLASAKGDPDLTSTRTPAAIHYPPAQLA